MLAGADVSVAMGSGSVLAQSSADMVLTAGRPGDLIAGVTLARRTLRVIRQNLAWAASYNTVALPLAAAGLVAPWMAALGMSASSLLVVANAARLGRERAAPARAGVRKLIPIKATRTHAGETPIPAAATLPRPPADPGPFADGRGRRGPERAAVSQPASHPHPGGNTCAS